MKDCTAKAWGYVVDRPEPANPRQGRRFAGFEAHVANVRCDICKCQSEFNRLLALWIRLEIRKQGWRDRAMPSCDHFSRRVNSRV